MCEFSDIVSKMKTTVVLNNISSLALHCSQTKLNSESFSGTFCLNTISHIAFGKSCVSRDMYYAKHNCFVQYREALLTDVIFRVTIKYCLTSLSRE